MNLKYSSALRTRLSASIVFFILGGSMTTTAAGFRMFGNTTNWEEEVMLQDGTKIVVTRSAERNYGGFKQQQIRFSLPNTDKRITWDDTFSEDVSGSSFSPMLIDIVANTPYLVASPAGCIAYNKWGRPNPPYVVFKYDGNMWQRIPLAELPIQITTPNLIFSSPDIEAKKSEGKIVSAEFIRGLHAGYKQPEFKTILREAVSEQRIGCGVMIPYGNGGWLGLDWFSEQPNREACLKFCAVKGVKPMNCPCKTLFPEDK